MIDLDLICHEPGCAQSGEPTDHACTDLGDRIGAGPNSDAVYMRWSDTRNRSVAGPDEDVFVLKTNIP
ncbi:MAG: hypothetical protein NVS3B21_33630 [Acidimicrobiales bacterium]